ncbi:MULTISPECIES: hypothetical protein [unclassified Lysobacter]|uniref:hypothetical protein n=1 Tax=unclassified Lysobacter TaxID=2635362 RepID=UPI0006FF294D|nr:MULTISPECIES: hypothetical protein [unclassified Lysobacter]KRA20970.1 hypothetical protein ASD69_06660 [Lysobacter sp. Root604]KRD80001.1 hypothetical protein ASE43_03695 [Lysobacter sp. Root983]
MKTTASVCSLALALGVGLFSALPAQASCQSICVRLYNICLASGESPAACEAERAACFADCGSGGGAKALSLQTHKHSCETAKRTQCEYRAPQRLRLSAS